MADLTSSIVDTGRFGNAVQPTVVALADTDNEFVNDGKTKLRVTNGDVGAHTLTVASVLSSVNRLEDLVITIPAGETRETSLFRPDLFNKAGGRVTFVVDAITSMTVELARVNPGQ